MVMMLTENDRFDLPDSIKADMQKFVETIKNDLPSADTLASNGFVNPDMNQIFNKLIQAFQLTL
jgi:hypothetical protein